MRATAAVLLLAVPAVAQERPVHFAHDVQPFLARQGCAAADCHGGATGRGGFKLSLFGGDPEADFRAITVDRDGRRLDLRAPERSLLLRKPTRDLDHGGGRRLLRGSAAWDALRAWIADGAPFDRGGRARIERLQLEVDGERLRATARFVWTDPGSGARRAADEDVSDRALFSTSAPDVVEVERSGRLSHRGPGEAWLFARFAGRDARVRIVTPFGDASPSDSDGASAIDSAWREGLAELGLDLAPAAGPDTMARRLYLDLAGRLPTPAERHAFLELPAGQRVSETVDSLLASDDFTSVAAGWLARWFEVADPAAPATDDRMRTRAAPIRADLRRVASSDDSLLDAIASRVDAPLIERFPDPRDRAELFGRAVLGIRLGCARCHDHPLDRWTRDDHLGFAALFVDSRPDAEMGMTEGALFDPKTGEAAVPALLPVLGAAPAELPSRARLGAALRADPEAFARNVANRVVAELLGHGLVEPVDDHRPTNPGVHPALLDALAAGFRAGGDRLRPLVRAVASSELYARTTLPADDELDGARVRYLARREARQMPEPLLLRAVARALAAPPRRATQASASPLASWLALWNGVDVHALLEARGNALELLAGLVDDDRERLDSLFEMLLTRTPTESERARLLPVLQASDDTRATLVRLAHAIVLSREFTSIR